MVVGCVWSPRCQMSFPTVVCDCDHPVVLLREIHHCRADWLSVSSFAARANSSGIVLHLEAPVCLGDLKTLKRSLHAKS